MHGSTPSRTVLLTERRTRRVRLGRDDVDFLLSGHRNHIAVVPAGERGVYYLTPAGHVGTLLGPGSRFVIRPKIPWSNFYDLLDPGLEPQPDAQDLELPDVFALRLAELMRQRAAAGLRRGYVEQSGEEPYLRGRPDLVAQLRTGDRPRERLACHYEEFTPNVLCNQIPRATAEALLPSPLLGPAARAALRQALDTFGPVEPVTPTPEAFAALLRDRSLAAYHPLLQLCQLLMTHSGPALLMDLENLFERYVTRVVLDTFATDPAVTVQVQRGYTLGAARAGQPAWHMRPDVTLALHGREVAALDVKWKDLRGPLITGDVYQVLAYAGALGLREAVLVYPGRRNRVWDYPMESSPLRVRILTLRVTGTREECRRARARLGRVLRLGL